MGERNICCLSQAPNWGPSPQPRHVPWLWIKPATFQIAGQHSVHWATPARAWHLSFLNQNIHLVLYEVVETEDWIEETKRSHYSQAAKLPKSSRLGHEETILLLFQLLETNFWTLRSCVNAWTYVRPPDDHPITPCRPHVSRPPELTITQTTGWDQTCWCPSSRLPSTTHHLDPLTSDWSMSLTNPEAKKARLILLTNVFFTIRTPSFLSSLEHSGIA